MLARPISSATIIFRCSRISQQNSIPAFTAQILYCSKGEETHLELVKLGGPLNLEENLLVVGVGDLDVKSVGVCKVAIEIKEKKREMSALVLILNKRS